MPNQSEPYQGLKLRAMFTNNRYKGCTNAGVHRTQKGFTLIELMIAVAIIGIMAAVAVAVFGRTQKTTKARAEVAAIFAEFKVRQEQAMLENREYLSSTTAVTIWHPASTPTNGNKASINPLPGLWDDLNITPPKAVVHCSYMMWAGEGGIGSITDIADEKFGFTVPDLDWYYMLARCDMDGDSSVYSYYFQHSGDDELFYVDQGK